MDKSHLRRKDTYIDLYRSVHANRYTSHTHSGTYSHTHENNSYMQISKCLLTDKNTHIQVIAQTNMLSTYAKTHKMHCYAVICDAPYQKK